MKTSLYILLRFLIPFGLLLVNICRHFLAIFEKKVLSQNGPYINTFKTDLGNVEFSVILELCLSSSVVACCHLSSSIVIVICVFAPDYSSLCRGLEYLLKVGYIIAVDSNGAGFLIFETVFLSRTATLSNVKKKYHKNRRHLRLVAHILTKLS